MSYLDDPLDKILVDCLGTIGRQTDIIENLVATTRKLKDALDLAVKEIKRLTDKAETTRNAGIA